MAKKQNNLNSLPEKMRLNNISQEQGSWSWLTMLVIRQLVFIFSNIEFWNTGHSRYEILLANALKPYIRHTSCNILYKRLIYDGNIALYV